MIDHATTLHPDAGHFPTTAASSEEFPASLEQDIQQTLMYYDIWGHPLTSAELYAFLPRRCPSHEAFALQVREEGPGAAVSEADGMFFLKARGTEVVALRRVREHYARMMWRMARLSMHLIKRFPFVRAVFISGDLSKNVSSRTSDVDFFIITSPGRLWITRTLLIAFKKIFLFNRKKFFCVNTFTTTDHLALDDRNIYVAAEIAHTKPLYNTALFQDYLRANAWIREFFPNYDPAVLFMPEPSDRRSLVQRILELPFALLPADRIDSFLLSAMKRVWQRRYPDYDEETRKRIFRSTKDESRAYPDDHTFTVLEAYRNKLKSLSVVRGVAVDQPESDAI